MHPIRATVLVSRLVLYLRARDDFAAPVAWTPFAVARVHLSRSVERQSTSVEVREYPVSGLG